MNHQRSSLKKSKWYENNKNTPAFFQALELIRSLSLTPTVEAIEEAFNVAKDKDINSPEEADRLRAIIEIGINDYGLDRNKQKFMFDDYKVRVADVRENESSRAFEAGEYEKEYSNYINECNRTKTQVITLLESPTKDKLWVRKAKQMSTHSKSLRRRILQLKGNQYTKASCVESYRNLKSLIERLDDTIVNVILDLEKAS